MSESVNKVEKGPEISKAFGEMMNRKEKIKFSDISQHLKTTMPIIDRTPGQSAYARLGEAWNILSFVFPEIFEPITFIWSKQNESKMIHNPYSIDGNIAIDNDRKAAKQKEIEDRLRELNVQLSSVSQKSDVVQDFETEKKDLQDQINKLKAELPGAKSKDKPKKKGNASGKENEEVLNKSAEKPIDANKQNKEADKDS